MTAISLATESGRAPLVQAEDIQEAEEIRHNLAMESGFLAALSMRIDSKLEELRQWGRDALDLEPYEMWAESSEYRKLSTLSSIVGDASVALDETLERFDYLPEVIFGGNDD